MFRPRNKKNEIPEVVALARSVLEKKIEAKDRMLADLGRASRAEFKSPTPEQVNHLADLRIAFQNAVLDIEIAHAAVADAEAENAEALRRADRIREEAEWKQLEKCEAEAMKVAKDLEASIDKLVPTLIQLEAIFSKALGSIPKTDGTPRDASLLSGPQLAGYFRLHMKKAGVHWAADYFDDPRKIKTISENVKEGFGWALKRRNEPVKEKNGPQ